MIELYSGATMNGRRAAIALAECGLAHRVHLLDLQKGHQRAADFLKLNPSGAIPVLVDDHGGVGTPVTVTQSGAIVLYCAEKSGRLIPSDPRRRRQAFEWFSQALTDVGPASSVIFRMSIAPEQSPSNVSFFEQRFLRHCSNVDRQLDGREFIADEFSIADVALYPIIAVREALIDAAAGLANLKVWTSPFGRLFAKGFIEFIGKFLNLPKVEVLKTKRGRYGGGTWASTPATHVLFEGSPRDCSRKTERHNANVDDQDMRP